VRNTVSSYTQTWNGTARTPANSTTTYNTTPSTTSCNYKCDTNYTRHNSVCNQNCSTTTNNWYSLPATDWGVSINPTKQVSITWWTQTKTQQFTCNNGTFTAWTETISNVTCNTNYVWDTGSQTCKSSSCTFDQSPIEWCILN
jgi:hypothetical protein